MDHENSSQHSSDYERILRHSFQKTSSHPSTIGMGAQQRNLSGLINYQRFSNPKQAMQYTLPLNMAQYKPQETSESSNHSHKNPNAPHSCPSQSTSQCPQQHEIIDADAIRMVECGEDQRTYVMLRNIPNQYNKEKLTAEISDKFEGTYELQHLPIDQQSKLNKGFAFLDFQHPLFFLDFFHHYNGKSWRHAPKSTKIFEFSYGKRKKGRQALTPVEKNKAERLRGIIDKYNLGMEIDEFKVKRRARRQEIKQRGVRKGSAKDCLN